MTCGCTDCEASRSGRASAKEHAEALLAPFLSPEQAEDWKANRAFNVRGSSGNWWRLAPRHGHAHYAVVRDDGIGVSVWPVGLEGEPLDADRALALMLYLQADESLVYGSGCKEHVPVRYWPRRATFGPRVSHPDAADRRHRELADVPW